MKRPLSSDDILGQDSIGSFQRAGDGDAAARDAKFAAIREALSMKAPFSVASSQDGRDKDFVAAPRLEAMDQKIDLAAARNFWRNLSVAAFGACALLAGLLIGLQVDSQFGAQRSTISLVGADAGELSALQERVRAVAVEMEHIRALLQNGHSSAISAAQASGQEGGPRAFDQDLVKKLDLQARRIERLERLMADPVVTSSISGSGGGGALVERKSPAKAPNPAPDGAPNVGADDEAGANAGVKTPAGSYILRGVHQGRATLLTQKGLIEVGPGDKIAGIGQVRTIEKVNGRWVLTLQDESAEDAP